MRILFINPEFPWPIDNGGKLRSIAILKALAIEHEITLAAPVDDDELNVLSSESADWLGGILPLPTDARRRAKMPIVGNRLRRAAIFTADLVSNPTPYVFRPISSEAADRITEAWPRFDAAVCRYPWMMPLLREIPGRRIILDADDISHMGLFREARNLTHGWGSVLVAAEAGRTYFHEQRIYRRVARTLVCSALDRERVGRDRASVVPNGVDLPPRELGESDPEPSTVVWVGTASYDPNTEGLRWFISQCWPEIRRREPNARFRIVGRNADAQTLPFADGIDGIELVGPVSMTGPWIAGGVLTVTPLFNGMGTRIKILESLACGRPVVATRIGAEGLDQVGTHHGLFRADNPQAMADRVVELLSNIDRARALGKAGRELAEARFTWEAATSGLAQAVKRWVDPTLQSAGI